MALKRDGVIDPILDSIAKESQRSVASHLDDLEAKLHAAQRTEKHIRYTRQFVTWICEYSGFEVVADISADGVHRYAQGLRKKDLSARTIQSHLNAIKAFTKWLAESHKLPRDSLQSVRAPNPEGDRRIERRMLLREEWPWLHSATLAGFDRYGSTGAERCLLYAVAIQTGLRANEIRQLRVAKCQLNSSPPHIICRASTTKNRKDARQFIEDQLAERLRDHIKSRPAKGHLFKFPHETNLARGLRSDLANARVAWLDDAREDPAELTRRENSDFLLATNYAGEIFDFHSLRHTCGAWLALAGEHPKVIQTVMRHSSIQLSMDTYGHLFPGQEAEAVKQFGNMFSPKSPLSTP